MASDSSWSGSDEDYHHQTRKPKRRKVEYKSLTRVAKAKSEEMIYAHFSLDPLLCTLRKTSMKAWDSDADLRDSFEAVIEPMLPELEEGEHQFLRRERGIENSEDLFLLPRSKAHLLRETISASAASSAASSSLLCLLDAKARLHSRVLRRTVLNRTSSYLGSHPVTTLRNSQATSAPNAQVLNALYDVKTTSYENSFLSRLHGHNPNSQDGVVAVDWETRTPWMELMHDIREHHSLAHPERERADETIAPIEYRTVQRSHLNQVHELLSRAFWDGIDVTDSLDHSPEKCTIIATYKQLVVGAAFLSSPQETYITYLAVRSGWDNSQVATSMLYHLITLNPHKDITLHVSINNPAMLLYNRFGFKAEEFIVGFYEDYVDPNSPQSKNAFRLRLRRW